MKNLFPAGKPVVGNMLIGRAELLNELETVLDIGQSVILVAPRRYGKTSVALEILKRFQKKGYFVADVDMFDVTDKRHLAEKIAESCLKNNPVPIEKYWQKLKRGALNVLSMLKFKPSDEDMEMVLQLGMPRVDEEKLLDDALDFPQRFGSRHKKRTIMFLDEFQELTKVGGDSLLKKMRAKLQRHDNVVYLFAGSQETLMTEIFQNKQHAFYRFGRIFEVGNIAKDDFAPYINKSFASEGIVINSGHIESVLDITGGHPYYTQLLCQILYIDCIKERRKKIDANDVENSITHVMEHEDALFDEIWKELGDKKYSRNIIGLISKGLSPYSYVGTTKENTARILADLVRYGYISKMGVGKKTRYDIKDTFFQRYVLSKVE